jgi:hypothetical protein
MKKEKKYLKKQESANGFTYYSFKKNHQRKKIDFNLILEELSSPVKIKKKS